MKIIEAMKKVKANKEKIADLHKKISQICANLSYETPVYGDKTKEKVQEFAQSCNDLVQDNIKLLTAISRTNLATPVTIMLGDKPVTKNMAEWIWRRREYAKVDETTWALMGDRGLKEGSTPTSTGEPMKITIIRHYDPVMRDQKVAMYKSEASEIDGALEVANAITDLIES